MATLFMETLKKQGEKTKKSMETNKYQRLLTTEKKENRQSLTNSITGL